MMTMLCGVNINRVVRRSIVGGREGVFCEWEVLDNDLFCFVEPPLIVVSIVLGGWTLGGGGAAAKQQH